MDVLSDVGSYYLAVTYDAGMDNPLDPETRIAADIRAVSVALQERDPSTHAHCDRVAALALELGRRCDLSSRELAILSLAAGFHDVGKIGIPDAVLKKQVSLSADDWVIMRSHSIRSERIILAAQIDHGAEVALAARHHHERFEGNGYPDRLAGEAIPYLSRIVAVADAYDAMARMRHYGGTRTHAVIMSELRREQGCQHDGYLIDKFAGFIDHSSFRADF
jgi:HD-GYP domain-containing protein (c-di-GMP phosphodiesterase class II)